MRISFGGCAGGEGAEAWAAMKYVESVVGQLNVPVTIIILWAVVQELGALPYYYYYYDYHYNP